ncbi:protein kinase [Chloracidobacterium validum]|uniref:Protein kinase n=1 Tax=Chloracidobacterium validum TaxID=2821543 RepID=A0ABX8B7S0_9BACT|nr:serine/threonine-protein kinase [Chloracidobacterium validum]QUW02106.1 protein kinase [Chloracidobacterium validum]
MTNPISLSTTSLVGQVIDDKVQLEAILGQGGMGAVYRGRHLLLERTVAVKVLRPEILTVEGALERFFREARMAAATEHPNIVTVYDFGKLVDGGAYLILEFVEGKNLRATLQEQVVIPPSLAIPILGEVCAAVEFAHRRNVIHRDLKPDNIMLKRRDDGSTTVKVLDFGLAKTVEEAETSSSITRTGELVGTPAYMSPEHCSGEDLDARSDLYSLGVIAYEMLTGQPPFRGRVAAILTAQIQRPPAPLRDLNPNLPPVLEEAVLAALAKKPYDRPTSVAEWWNRLEAAYVAAYGEKPSTTVPLSLPEPAPFVATAANGTTSSAVNQKHPSQGSTLQVSNTLLPSPAGETVGLVAPPGTGEQKLAASSKSSLSTPQPIPRAGTGTLAIGAASAQVEEPVTVQTVVVSAAPNPPKLGSLHRLGLVVGGVLALVTAGGIMATSWMRSAAPVTQPVQSPVIAPAAGDVTPPPASPTATPVTAGPVTAPPASPADTPSRRPSASNKASDNADSAPARPSDTARGDRDGQPRRESPSPDSPTASTPRQPTEAPRTPPPGPQPRSSPGAGTGRNPSASRPERGKPDERRWWQVWKIGRDKDKDKPRRPRD